MANPTSCRKSNRSPDATELIHLMHHRRVQRETRAQLPQRTRKALPGRGPTACALINL